jgi:hypothetical protein
MSEFVIMFLYAVCMQIRRTSGTFHRFSVTKTVDEKTTKTSLVPRIDEEPKRSSIDEEEEEEEEENHHTVKFLIVDGK